MKHKLLTIAVLYLCLYPSFVVSEDTQEEENESEEGWNIGSKNAKEMAKKLIGKAIDKTLEIFSENREKAQAFVDERLDIDIQPEKEWKTEDMFVPSGFHIAAQRRAGSKKQKGEGGEQAFIYPYGVGGVLMNGCFAKNYNPGDPCYKAFWETSKCMRLIDGAAFLGVGLDIRGWTVNGLQESRKLSIIQRNCARRTTYEGFDVPDIMTIHSVYDTSAKMDTFSSREEYKQSLQEQAGVSGHLLGLYGGEKHAWGASSLGGSQEYIAEYSIKIDRYEIYLDEVKPDDLSISFLREFMDLPMSYFAPGAPKKFQNFIQRWGTHYVKSGKFGGRLNILKTMEASQVSSKEEFSQVMEGAFRTLFSSFHSKNENSESSSRKKERKMSTTSLEAVGGDQEIAALITDFNSPTIKADLNEWLESIPTYPKAYEIKMAPITDLLKFTAHPLFPNEERDWGCEAQSELEKDPDTDENYYEVNVNGTAVKKFCKYLDREHLMYGIERRRNSLIRAIGVYSDEGVTSTTEIELLPGSPGCQTENIDSKDRFPEPLWNELAGDGQVFKVIIYSKKVMDQLISKHYIKQFFPVMPERKEIYVRLFRGIWSSSWDPNKIDTSSLCNPSASADDHKICIRGLILTYQPSMGMFTLDKAEFQRSKNAFPFLTEEDIDTIIGRVELLGRTAIGSSPCNVKWSNTMRFDPSEGEGMCLHFTLVTHGTAYVIFSSTPSDQKAWYYVRISSRSVEFYKAHNLTASTFNINALGLGSAILFQSYFICLKESSEGTLIEYGKSQGISENRHVYLSMVDKKVPLFPHFYSFGNGEDPVQLVDVQVMPRQLSNVECRGDTALDKEQQLCVQNCHQYCDPAQGCRAPTDGKPSSASDCNGCLYGKNEAGKCLAEK